MIRFSTIAGIASLGITVLTGSCVFADSPTAVRPEGVPLPIAAGLVPSPADATALPINRIRAIVVRASDNSEYGRQAFDVSPTADSWSLSIDVPPDVPVTVTLLLINVADGGAESVQFSGMTGPVAASAGTSGPAATATVVRGGVENLFTTSVVIETVPQTMIVGTSGSLSAAVTTSGQTPPTVFWTALDPAIVSVVGSTATAVAVGTGRVVATAGAFSDTASIEVLPQPVDSVVVSPDSAMIHVGDTVTFQASLFDALGQALTGRDVRWSVTDTMMARVDTLTGRVSGLSGGSTTVTATSEGVSDDAIVVVGVPTGSIEVMATTTGTSLPSGYSAIVGATTKAVPTNGSVTFSGLAVGAHTVTFADVASNCTLAGTFSKTAVVEAGATTLVTYSVECGDPVGLLTQASQALEDALFATVGIASPAGLDTITFQTAKDLYTQALSFSPSNDTAAFGVAITTIFTLEDDPDLRALVDDWDAWITGDTAAAPVAQALVGPALSQRWVPGTLPLELPTLDLERLARTGLVATDFAKAPLGTAPPPPSITENQTVLDETVRPALEAALSALAEVTDPAFVFTVTERMQGEDPATADPLELDYTEVLALRAALDVAIAAIDLATAYIFEPNPLDAEGLVDALTPGSTFLTLGPGGATKLSDALTKLQSAAAVVLEALDNLEAEVDDQTDDIIKYDPTGLDGLTAQDIDDARTVVQDVSDALSAPTTVTVGGVSVTVDAREFFIDPIPDFKALLPDYEVFTAMEESTTVPVFRWTADNLDEWAFPDPTFSGILPDFTSTQDLIDNLGIDELFWHETAVGGNYQLISVDGLDCYDDLYNGGNGCLVADQYYWYFGSIDLSGSGGTSQAYVSLSGAVYTGASGPFVVTDNGDGTYTVDMTLTDDLGALNLNGVVTATVVDQPGYTSLDSYFRSRGGSTLTFSHNGSTWVFEKQY